MCYIKLAKDKYSGTSVNSYRDDRLELVASGGYFFIMHQTRQLIKKAVYCGFA